MVTALVLSGGSGTRMGTNIPKQYIKVCGRMVISYCLKTIVSHGEIDTIQVVADKMWRDTVMDVVAYAEGGMADGKISKFMGFSDPGKTRQLSILNGLEDIMGYASVSDYVLIHDAARPLLPSALITDCINAIKGHDGVLPVLPMKDTVYFSRDGRKVSSLLERSSIFAGQAPEMFVLGKYYEANKRLLPDAILKINGSAEPSVMAGMDIAMIPGDEVNFKITVEADLERFRECLKHRH